MMLATTILQDFMSGKTLFRNIMGILLPGVNSIITQRSTQTYGLLLEKAVLLSLEILILVLEKDIIVSDYWRPLYQVFVSIIWHCFVTSLVSYSCIGTASYIYNFYSTLNKALCKVNLLFFFVILFIIWAKGFT